MIKRNLLFPRTLVRGSSVVVRFSFPLSSVNILVSIRFSSNKQDNVIETSSTSRNVSRTPGRAVEGLHAPSIYNRPVVRGFSVRPSRLPEETCGPSRPTRRRSRIVFLPWPSVDAAVRPADTRPRIDADDSGVKQCAGRE